MLTRRRLLTAMASGSAMLVAPRARAELDSGTSQYLIYGMSQGGTQIGRVLVALTEGGGYAPNHEYWYMTANVSSRTAVTITGGASKSWSNPPTGLGTLSFLMANTSSWSRGTRSGIMHTYEGIGEYEAMHWQMVETSGVWTGSITWWQNSTSGHLFGAGVARTLTPLSTSGTAYYINNTPL